MNRRQFFPAIAAPFILQKPLEPIPMWKNVILPQNGNHIDKNDVALIKVNEKDYGVQLLCDIKESNIETIKSKMEKLSDGRGFVVYNYNKTWCGFIIINTHTVVNYFGKRGNVWNEQWEHYAVWIKNE